MCKGVSDVMSFPKMSTRVMSNPKMSTPIMSNPKISTTVMSTVPIWLLLCLLCQNVYPRCLLCVIFGFRSGPDLGPDAGASPA